MTRTARTPFLVGLAVLVTALVVLIVRVQGDDTPSTAAGDGAAAPGTEQPSDPADDAAPDPTIDDGADDADADHGPDDAAADDDPESDPEEPDATNDRGQDATDGDTDGVRGDDGPDRPTSDATTAEGDDEDDLVIAADDLTRDRVPGSDPLPDTGGTSIAVALIALLSSGLVHRRR